jgi:hypothetical protein
MAPCFSIVLHAAHRIFERVKRPFTAGTAIHPPFRRFPPRYLAARGGQAIETLTGVFAPRHED